MARTLTIADAHSSHKPTQTLRLELQGGSPWFVHVWIDDVCHTVTRSDNSKRVAIKRTRLGE